jgi:hypothetical protein
MLTELKNSSEKQVTKVTLEWRDGRNDTEAWNEICAWTIEQFGMPGTRYTWHPAEDYMNFYFYKEEDAIHFMLRWL